MKSITWLLFVATLTVLLALSFSGQSAKSVATYQSIVLPVRSTYSTLTTAAVTSTSAVIVNRNPSRNYIIAQNKGTATIYCKIEGTAPTATTADIEIASGGNWEPDVIPVDALACIAASGNHWIAVVEGEPY